MRHLLAVLGLLLATAAPASAGTFKPSLPLNSASNGIALGADGNFWVAEQFAKSIAKVSPQGEVLDHVAVGGSPVAVAAGPDGFVWATVTDAKKLVKIDTAAVAPTAVDVPTGVVSSCGPVGLANGGDGLMYVSLPNDGVCVSASALTSVVAATNGVNAAQFGRGTVYDLAVAGGKLFAPDLPGDVVRRMGLGALLPVESTVNVPAGSGPDGVTVEGGSVWVTLFSAGKVARFPIAQVGGDATALTPAGVTLTNPFGIAPSNLGGVWVAGSGSGNLVRVATDGTFTQFALPDSEPWDLAATADGVWITDRMKSRVVQYADAAPTVTTGAVAATGRSTATFDGTVDTHGNATQFRFVWGTAPDALTESTSVAEFEGSAGGPSAVNGTLDTLLPGTTYYIAARATNARGEVTGEVKSFTTEAKPEPPPVQPPPTGGELPAKVKFKAKVRGDRTRFKKIKVVRLEGGETIRVRCRNRKRGCGFKRAAFRRDQWSSKSLKKLFRKPLRPGAKVTISVSKKGFDSVVTTLIIRDGKKPLRSV